jgi:hypothetical protein
VRERDGRAERQALSRALKIGLKIAVALAGGVVGGYVLFFVGGVIVFEMLVPRAEQYRYIRTFDAVVWGSMPLLSGVFLWLLFRARAPSSGL